MPNIFLVFGSEDGHSSTNKGPHEGESLTQAYLNLNCFT